MLHELFAVGDSTPHRLDPRIRLILAAVYSCVVALCRDFPALLAALIQSMALVALAHLRTAEVLKRLLEMHRTYRLHLVNLKYLKPKIWRTACLKVTF